MTASPLSASVEDYLKAIWLVAGKGSASTNALAEQLGVSAPSVSGMLARLQEQDLVRHERYRGVRLTARGQREALRLMRRHRLIETFMTLHLGYRWDEVHHEAERLEHAVSDRFAERLDAFLGHPSHDPHGDPIPGADGSLPETPNTPLSELEPGERLLVSRLLTQDDAVLRYLAEQGVQPGARLRLVARERVGGLWHVALEGESPRAPKVLARELATLVRGEKV